MQDLLFATFNICITMIEVDFYTGKEIQIYSTLILPLTLIGSTLYFWLFVQEFLKKGVLEQRAKLFTGIRMYLRS